jgi:predicted transglutaminase-like protease
MKLALQYLSDSDGEPRAVQLPIADWKKVLEKLKKYEQTLKIKSDLTEAFEEVAFLRKSKEKKQTLTDFLDEL